MPALSNDDWWRRRVAILERIAAPLSAISPDAVYDKAGAWPAIKLVWVQYGLGIYAPIITNRKKAGQFTSLHFIDACAGSGLTRLQLGKSKQITVAGTAAIGASNAAFDSYHFIEPNKKAAAVLDERLERLLPRDRFKTYSSDRAGAIGTVVTEIRESSRKPHFFAVVDPEGFTEITLPQLQPLFALSRGDFVFNFQHVGVKRAPPAAAAFLGDDSLASGLRTMADDDVVDLFAHRVAESGRPVSKWIPVERGEGPYAYGILYAAVETHGGNAWLNNYSAEVDRRMVGIDGRVLENILLGQKELREPGDNLAKPPRDRSLLDF